MPDRWPSNPDKGGKEGSRDGARMADKVVGATDDPHIWAAVESFSGAVVTTRRYHPGGADRVRSAARLVRQSLIPGKQQFSPED
jgi:hypothetical protein